MDPADANAPGNGRFWRAVLIAVAAVPLLGVGALFALALLYHDCGEARAGTDLQVFLAARRIQDAALQAGGVFSASDADEVGALLALDPWGRPFRYERIGDDGRRARVYTLGEDGEPGGQDCDEDIVVWADLEETHLGSDARVPPAAWR